MTDQRPIIQLHTLEQWFQVDPNIRALILQNIKLKEKLWKHLSEHSKRPPPEEPFWAPCSKCDRRGWFEIHPRYPGIHPSQINSPCMLKLYKELVGEDAEKKTEPRLQLIFDLGHAVHHMFQTYGMRGAWGTNYVPEAPIGSEASELGRALMIEGHADADTTMLVDIPGSPVLYDVGIVHEYKTINSKNFSKLTRPKPEHQMQATIYSACLNRPVVAYLYFSKDDSNLADFAVEFNNAVWTTVSGKIQMMLNFYKAGIPPKGETGYHCQDCPYVHNCQDYREQMTKGKP